MNFLIFRDFSGFFLNYFRFLMIKSELKRLKRGYIFTRDPRGCDVALRATWQRHAGPRECLHGAEVTRDIIYIYSYYIGL